MNDQVSLICVCNKLPFSCSIQYNLSENSRLIGGVIIAQNLTCCAIRSEHTFITIFAISGKQDALRAGAYHFLSVVIV